MVYALIWLCVHNDTMKAYKTPDAGKVIATYKITVLIAVPTPAFN